MENNKSVDIKPREIVLPLFLTFITLGFYGFFWQYKLTNEIHAISGNPRTTSGGEAVLYTILTLGIYGYYWFYQIGKELSETRETHQLSADSVSEKTYILTTIIFTILGIFWEIFYSGSNILGLYLDASKGRQAEENFAVAAFIGILLVLTLLLHVIVAAGLILYVKNRKTKVPALLYVLLGFFRTHVFTLAFPQLALNDLLKNGKLDEIRKISLEKEI